MEKINLIYFADKSKHGNFGDELSKFITLNLINTEKYDLTYNQPQNENIKSIIVIGSYIHNSMDGTYIFGAGVRTNENKENGHAYKNIKISAVRGPKTRSWLIERGHPCPKIYGDPALLLPLYYAPKNIENLNHLIGIIPHKSTFKKYVDLDTTKYFLINPLEKWSIVVDQISSCSSIMSESLHGLIVSDAFKKRNVWLNQYALDEGEFKFIDYFLSQNRPIKKIKNQASLMKKFCILMVIQLI